MKIWIGKDGALRYWQEHFERARERAIYGFWRKSNFRFMPRISIVEYCPLSGGKSRAFFFSWLGLIVWVTDVENIARLDRWEFKDPHICGYYPAIHDKR